MGDRVRHSHALHGNANHLVRGDADRRDAQSARFESSHSQGFLNRRQSPSLSHVTFGADLEQQIVDVEERHAGLRDDRCWTVSTGALREGLWGRGAQGCEGVEKQVSGRRQPGDRIKQQNCDVRPCAASLRPSSPGTGCLPVTTLRARRSRSETKPAKTS